MPSTATAVVVFMLIVTPGVVFELLWQRTRPRRDESAFVEIGRVLLTGVVFSGLAMTILGLLAAVVPGAAASVTALVGDGPAYVTRNPGLVLGSLVTVVLLASCCAVVAHDLLTPPTARRIAQETVWHTAFGRLTAPGARAYLSVQLKDGTTIMGYAAGYATEPEPAKRDLLLTAPLKMRPPGQPTSTPLSDDWQSIVVAGAEISTIAVAYVDEDPTPPANHPTPLGRAVTWLTRHTGLAALLVAAVVLVAQAVLAVAL